MYAPSGKWNCIIGWQSCIDPHIVGNFQNPVNLWRIWTASNTRFVVPTWVCLLNGILIGSAIFACFSCVPTQHTVVPVFWTGSLDPCLIYVPWVCYYCCCYYCCCCCCTATVTTTTTTTTTTTQFPITSLNRIHRSISTMFNSTAISSGWRCYLFISRS